MSVVNRRATKGMSMQHKKPEAGFQVHVLPYCMSAAKETLRNRTRCRASFLKVAAPVAFGHHGETHTGKNLSGMLHKIKTN